MDGNACHSNPSHWDRVGSVRCNGLLGIDNAVHCRQSTTVGSDGYWLLRHVYTPWRLGKATPSDEGSKTSNQPSGASFKATESPNRASREIKDTLQ